MQTIHKNKSLFILLLTNTPPPRTHDPLKNHKYTSRIAKPPHHLTINQPKKRKPSLQHRWKKKIREAEGKPRFLPSRCALEFRAPAIDPPPHYVLARAHVCASRVITGKVNRIASHSWPLACTRARAKLGPRRKNSNSSPSERARQCITCARLASSRCKGARAMHVYRYVFCVRSFGEWEGIKCETSEAD